MLQVHVVDNPFYFKSYHFIFILKYINLHFRFYFLHVDQKKQVIDVVQSNLNRHFQLSTKNNNLFYFLSY